MSEKIAEDLPAVKDEQQPPLKKKQKKKKNFRRASQGTRFVSYVAAVKKEYLVWCQGMLFFKNEEAMDFANFKKVLMERLVPIGRMHSRFDFKRSGFVEMEVEEFDETYHFTEVNEEISLEEVGNRFMGNVYGAKKIDFDKPLWYCHFFPKLEDGRSLAVVSISHTLGDGVALVELLFSIMDKSENVEKMEEEGVVLEQEDKDAVRPKGKRKVKNPYGPLNRARIISGGVMQAFASAAAKADSKTPLSRKNLKEFSLEKSYAFTEPISLDEVKEIKSKIQGATINDVLVALLNIIMIDFMEENGMSRKKMKKKKIRAGFPINMRKKKKPILKDDGSPGNNFAFGLFRFFTGYKNRIELVHKVKRRIDQIKLSPYPIVQAKLGGVLSKIMSRKAYGQLLSDFIAQSTAQLSNVAGPQKAVSLGGAELDSLEFGLYSTVGVYLGLMSYNGKVSCCVCMDSSIGEAKDLAKFWKPEFEALYADSQQIEGGFSKTPKSCKTMLTKI